MDILTDIFSSFGLVKSVLAKRSFNQDFVIKFPCDLSMGFHAVSQGQVYLRRGKGLKPILLEQGDIVLVKRGLSHELASDLKTKRYINSKEACTLPENELSNVTASLISGVYQFQTDPIHPLFFEFPDFIVVNTKSLPIHDPLNSVLQLLSSEIESSKPGSDAVTKSLIDVLFHLVLREWMGKHCDKQQSWTKAIKDKSLLQTMEAIHEKPDAQWTVESLAKVAGSSRASFAKKFKQYTGDTPANYITKVRIQKSLELLRTTDRTIQDIAYGLGYSDAFTFSKVFKKVQKYSPSEYRKNILSK